MTVRNKRLLILTAAVAALSAGAYKVSVNLWYAGIQDPPAASQPSTRPAQWAQPMQAPGLGNFFKVSDGLYRGQQPEGEGFASLKALGIKTVVNLRVLHSDRKKVEGQGLKYVEIEFNPAHAEMEDVVKFLRVVTDPANGPVFVHCQHGSDRTGTMVAAYRVFVDGWSPQQALEEMTQGGYGFHEQWVNLAEFVRRLDAKELHRLVEQK